MYRNMLKREPQKKKQDFEDQCRPEYCLLYMILKQVILITFRRNTLIHRICWMNWLNTTDDHPLIAAAVVYYQLVTIHPFEDGNGRTAILLSGYILDINGYGFNEK